MNKTLGKIFTLILLSTSLFAGVSVSVDKNAVYSGEIVQYTITVEGKNPKFPNLNKIAGYGVRGVSTSQSVNIINGNYKSTISKTYSFAPDRSLDIPSYKVIVDGKEYKTDEISVDVVKPTASKKGDDFSVRIDMDKNDVYVGEPVKVDVKFSYKLSSKADKIMISPLKMSDFWVKGSKKPVKSIQKDVVTQTYHYLVFPQKQGDFEVKPVEANIGVFSRRNSGGNLFRDPFFDSFDQTLTWKKYISNKLYIHVKPLPNNLEVFGKFDIKTSVDKTEVKANKPVNLTIKINGEGNIDDVKKFALDIDGVVVYSDEPKIRGGLNGGVYGGVFTQKVALIADKDFTIPSLKFSYFDKDLKKVVTKKTAPIQIKVKGGKKQEIVPKLDTKDDISQKSSNTEKSTTIQPSGTSKKFSFLYIAIGFLLGVLVSTGFFKFRNKKTVKAEMPIIKKIKKSKNDKELFEILLPYGKNDNFIKNILETLEENIYAKGEKKINKKELIQYFLDNE
jgi:hypothetical protein